MRALQAHRVEDWNDPAIGERDVLIDVKAIGLNFPDTLMLQGKYQTRPDRPFVPGRDASGVVGGGGAEGWRGQHRGPATA
jgi:NADPH2:quinone reductase